MKYYIAIQIAFRLLAIKKNVHYSLKLKMQDPELNIGLNNKYSKCVSLGCEEME